MSASYQLLNLPGGTSLNLYRIRRTFNGPMYDGQWRRGKYSRYVTLTRDQYLEVVQVSKSMIRSYSFYSDYSPDCSLSYDGEEEDEEDDFRDCPFVPS